MTTPREALEHFLSGRRADKFGGCYAPKIVDVCDDARPCWCKNWAKKEADAILTALSPWLDNQRTPGTVEFCVRCQVDCKGRDFDQNEVVGHRWIDCPDPTCPFKQVTK